MKLQEYLVDYAAGVLSNKKSANLFMMQVEDEEAFILEKQRFAEILKPFGISIYSFRRDEQELVYIYRKERLEEDLSNQFCSSCLKKKGYDISSVESLIESFREKIQALGDFPHEIGFLLGYPCGDVLHFLEDIGKKPLLTGYWQVYTDIDCARARFGEITRHKEEYRTLLSSGTPFELLPFGK